MALNYRVKVDGVDNLSTARYAGGMLVDWIGIKWMGNDPAQIEQLERFFSDVSGWVSGTEWVLECEYLSTEAVTFAQKFDIKLIEIQDFNPVFNNENFKYIWKPASGQLNRSALEELGSDVSFIKVPLKELSQAKSIRSSFSSIGIMLYELKSIEDLNSPLISQIQPAIALKTTSESQTGYLSDDLLMDFLEALDEDS